MNFIIFVWIITWWWFVVFFYCCCFCLVTKLCPFLCDPMNCTLQGSFVHEISQARVLEWVAISSSRGFFDPGINPLSLAFPALAGGFFTTEQPGKPFLFCVFYSLWVGKLWMWFSFPRAAVRRRQWHPTPVLLPRNSHGRRSLVGCSPWGR